MYKVFGAGFSMVLSPTPYVLPEIKMTAVETDGKRY
jgi:hypothetical protein